MSAGALCKRERADGVRQWKGLAANPVVDAGRFHVGVARANIDTRNDDINPSTGWLILAEYERGSGQLTAAGPTSPWRVPWHPSRSPTAEC